MEVRRSDLPDHATSIAQVLASLWGTKLRAPLVRPYESDDSDELVITFVGGDPNPSLPLRNLTTDLGLIETVLGLPIPNVERPRFWIGLHESWAYRGKRKVDFLQCGLRVYAGAGDEDSRQFLRLEWVAPRMTSEGVVVYQGAYAAHPHWHIDRAALVGSEDHLRSLELLTTPPAEASPMEVFSEATESDVHTLIQDLSWLSSVHLPAQSGWMHHNWNGQDTPGPHQSAPERLEMLTRWWEGSLRYVFAELSKHATG